MHLLFHLSGENLDLAREEVLALSKSKKHQHIKNVLVLNGSYKIYDRLAFTHGIFRILFACNNTDLIEEIGGFNFQKSYKDNFRVRILNLTGKEISFDEKQLGSLIYKKLDNPKVDLSNSVTQFFFIFVRNKVVCCKLLKRIKKDFYERKPHLKPEMHPTGLSPKLAKALINLTGIEKGVLLDPFCGSGGILVEAGLMGLKTVGFDIDEIMLNRAKINLEYYNVEKYNLKLQDAAKITGKYNYIASELPFGKNSKISCELDLLYHSFLKRLDKMLVKKAVLVFPDTIDYKKFLKGKKLKIEHEFSYYIHKSMTKKIVVLTRK